MGKLSKAIEEVSADDEQHLGNCCNLHVALTAEGVDEDDIAAVVDLVYGYTYSTVVSKTLSSLGISMAPGTVQKHRKNDCTCCRHHGWGPNV